MRDTHQETAVIAVYNLKGGVGKTTLAVNLGWASATLSARRTLLWDLDPQAAAGFLLGADGKAHDSAHSVFTRDVAPDRLISPTLVDRLDLLPADTSLRELDQTLFALGKKRRLARLIEGLGGRYDRIILDCPPGLTPTTVQILHAADVILVPIVPNPMSRRALDAVLAYLDHTVKRHGAVLPVFSMVDIRRRMHRDMVAELPDWPRIPYSSLFEQMAQRHAAIGAFAARSPASVAITGLWQAIERRLVQRSAARD